MKFDKIVFYNHFNNGDIFLSKNLLLPLVRSAKEKKIPCFYTHKKDPCLLLDIDDLIYDKDLLTQCADEYAGPQIKNKTLWINTWYAGSKQKYINTHGISFDTLYDVFDTVAKKYFDFSLDQFTVQDLFPSINFAKFEISEAMRFVEKSSGPIVLVCNGKALSGQAANFPMMPVVRELAKKYQGLVFVLTEQEEEKLPHNVFLSKDIIKKSSGSDLNENAYLSTQASIVIGRSSGVFTFSLLQENLFYRKDLDLISFSNLNFPSGKFWLGTKFADKVTYQANIQNDNVTGASQAISLIDEVIQRKYCGK